MATVSERTGVVGPSDLHEIAWNGGRDHGRASAPGMEIPRVFSREGTSPYDEVEWDARHRGNQGRARPDHFPAD